MGALVVARQLWPLVQRETEIELDLGPGHLQVVEVQLSYLLEGEELQGVSFRFAGGAPARFRHRIKLPAGDLELQCVLRSRDGASRVLTRRLHTPVDGLVRFWLAGSA